MARSIWQPLLAAAALLFQASCASSGGGSEGPLPFKVAVIPFRVERPVDVPLASEAPGSVIPLLSEERLCNTIRESVGRQFVDAVLLPYPDDTTPEQFDAWTQSAQDQHWVDESIELQADLILACDLQAPTAVSSSHNEKFWMNVPLFLLFGPVCYFVNDTTYSGESRLRASLHAVVPLQENRATLRNERAEVARFDLRFDQVTLDFIDRAQPLSYLASIVVPPGFLALDNPRVCERVGSEFAIGLAGALERQIRESSSTILMADRVADFFLKRDVAAEVVGSEITVRGEVVLQQAGAEGMREYAIVHGTHRTTGTLELTNADPLPGAKRGEYCCLPFSRTIPAEKGVDRVRLEFTQGGRERIRRSFTLLISTRASGDPLASGAR